MRKMWKCVITFVLEIPVLNGKSKFYEIKTAKLNEFKYFSPIFRTINFKIDWNFNCKCILSLLMMYDNVE